MMNAEHNLEPDRSVADRRPLTSRNKVWAKRLARYLSGTSITPNQISYCSIIFAVIAFLSFALSGYSSSSTFAVCMLVAVIACQLRLICNLMDGMVAIEAGKQTPDGAVWNEFPDRIADILILVGLGVAADFQLLGWVAAIAAVLVAYIRELGKSIDGVADFTGPMAKPHRMALVSIGAILAALSELLIGRIRIGYVSELVLQLILLVLIAGSVITVWRRIRAILKRVGT